MLYKKTRKALASLTLWGFILGIWRGYVAVWQAEDPQPLLYRTDTPASSLPPVDRETLRRGLRFASREALTAALEDFCS